MSMEVLIVDGGVVTNCIAADDVDRAQLFYPNSTCIERVAGESASTGWLYDGVSRSCVASRRRSALPSRPRALPIRSSATP
jgi:hypothetical protein